MKSASFVGQVGYLLVGGFTSGNLERVAERLVHIPDQIAPDRLIVGSPKEAAGDSRDVFVIRIVYRDTGVAVQVWRPIYESLDPASLCANRPPGHSVECLDDPAGN